MTQTAWIIGGGSGIGAAVAKRLASQGWTVAISGRRVEKLEEVGAGVPAIRPYRLDVTDQAAIEEVVRQLAADFGRIDLCLFGAASWQPMRIGDYDADKFGAVINTNLMGLVRLANPLFAQFDRQGGGQLAVLASVAGYFGIPRAAAYNASKAALINLLETMRTEVRSRGIVVRMIAPGFVKSELTARNSFPMPFLMETEDAARIIVDGLTKSTRFEIAFPRRMVWLMKAVRALPYPVFFALMRRLLPKEMRQ